MGPAPTRRLALQHDYLRLELGALCFLGIGYRNGLIIGGLPFFQSISGVAGAVAVLSATPDRTSQLRLAGQLRRAAIGRNLRSRRSLSRTRRSFT